MQLDQIICSLRMWPGRNAEEKVTGFVKWLKKENPIPQKIPKLITFTFIPHQIIPYLN